MRTLLAVAIPLLMAAAACSSGEGPADAGAVSSPLSEFAPDEIPLIKGPVSVDGLQAIFATPDLGVGENRVGFVLTSPEGLVRSPAATVSSTFFPEGELEGEVRETTLAVFRPWPYGTRGLYSTRLSFDRPGTWGIEMAVLNDDGTTSQTSLRFEVGQRSSTPAVGEPAVGSISKTIESVERIGQLTTGSLQDSELYRLTIADAIVSGKPTVVVMASPAFCTNAVCGPQVEVLQQLKDAYEGEANFIHVDIYDNPEEIQGDLDRARLSSTVVEWALPSTEWSFVIDRQGVVAARFEAFATLDELEQALKKVL